MFRSILPSLRLVVVAALVSTAPSAAFTAPVPGPISVKQVLDLFDTVQTDPEAGKLLYAYLSGIGETAGVLISAARERGGLVSCDRSLSLDGTTAEAALRKAGGSPEKRAVTPVIIEDMLARAACK